MPWPLVAALGLGWAALSWSEYRAMQVEEIGIDEAIVERYYDRGLRLLEAADRANAYGKWVAGAYEEKEVLEAELDTIRKSYAEELGEDGRDLVELLVLKTEGSGSITRDFSDEAYRAEFRSWLLEGHGAAWHYELFLEATEDPAVAAFYAEQNDRLIWRSVAMSAAFDILTVTGLFCVILLLIKRPTGEKLPFRFPEKWSARALLGGFFALSLAVYPWIFAVGILYQIWIFLIPESVAYLFYDLAWRAFPAAMLTWLFLKTPRNAWRVFGMSRPVNWILLLAVLGLTSLVDIAIFQFGPSTEADPTDFMEMADPDLAAMLALLFSSVIVAPVFEELVFRGFLFQGLRLRIGNLQAGIISTALFALVHIQYDIWGWLSVASMGAGAAYLTLRTGSLKSAIVLHAIINLLVTANVYYQYQLPL